MDDDDALVQLDRHRKEARVLRAAGVALGAAAALLVVTPAGSASRPGAAAMLAASLKTSMRSYYARTWPGLRLTGVTCTLSANEQHGSCQARFTLASRGLVGVFGLSETIDRSSGVVHTRTVSLACTNPKSGARASC